MDETDDPIAPPTPGLNGGEASAWVNLDDYDLSLITDEDIDKCIAALEQEIR